MKNKRFRLRKNYYLVIWSCICMAAIYILIRFAAISFSDNVGQAKVSLKERIFSNLYIMALESGSSFLEYRSKGEESYSVPMNMITDAFKVSKFTKKNDTNTTTDSVFLNQNLKNEMVRTMNSSSEIKDSKEVKDTLNFKNITEGYLSKEYVLTNGASSNSFLKSTQTASQNRQDKSEDELSVGYVKGEVYLENDDKDNLNDDDVEVMQTNSGTKFTLNQLKDTGFLVRNFYIVDSATKVTDELFNAKDLLGKDMTLKKNEKKPQILIYHTHAHESYCDSREGEESDTVVGVGSYLTNILEETYGYQVIHDKTSYDLMDGVFDRSLAYNRALPSITKTLKDNPSIEVVIDLHRDGNKKRVVMIDGKETAQVMLFNGLCRDQNGPLTRLENPHLKDNLAFSLQLQMKSLEMYPGLFYKNYLHCYRYNEHLRGKSILMELGTDRNTLESAKNAMKPFAKILDAVLEGK